MQEHSDKRIRQGGRAAPHTVSPVRAPVIAALVAGLALIALGQPARSADAPAPPPAPGRSFTAGYDLVWSKLLDTLKSLELDVATKNKDDGKVTTAPHRYFKISSAKFPPIQEDYRDTYEILLEKQADKKSTTVTIKRKFEYYDKTMPPNGGWSERQSSNTIGVSEDDIFSTLSLELAAAALPAVK